MLKKKTKKKNTQNKSVTSMCRSQQLSWETTPEDDNLKKSEVDRWLSLVFYS
jgi:hypothetical protein